MTILNILVHKDSASVISKQVTEAEAYQIAQNFTVQVEVEPGVVMDYKDYVESNAEPEDQVEQDDSTEPAADANQNDGTQTDANQVADASTPVGDGATGDEDNAVINADAGTGE